MSESADTELPEWEVVKCHFCGGFGMELPWRAGSRRACRPCGERERLAYRGYHAPTKPQEAK